MPEQSPRRWRRCARSRQRRNGCRRWPRRSRRMPAPRPIWTGSTHWPAMDRQLRRSLMILAAVTLVTAWFSVMFYFPDEHYQVLEFMSFKLGITPASELPWEFSARIRPWFQPALYFLIARPLSAVGVRAMST